MPRMPRFFINTKEGEYATCVQDAETGQFSYMESGGYWFPVKEDLKDLKRFDMEFFKPVDQLPEDRVVWAWVKDDRQWDEIRQVVVRDGRVAVYYLDPKHRLISGHARFDGGEPNPPKTGAGHGYLSAGNNNGYNYQLIGWIDEELKTVSTREAVKNWFKSQRLMRTYFGTNFERFDSYRVTIHFDRLSEYKAHFLGTEETEDESPEIHYRLEIVDPSKNEYCINALDSTFDNALEGFVKIIPTEAVTQLTESQISCLFRSEL